MPLSSNIDRYLHLLPVWESALAPGGAVIELASAGEAFRMRHELYHLRKLLFEKQKDDRFNHLQIGLKKGDLKLTLSPPKINYRITTIEGSSATLYAANPSDSLLDHARNLAKQLETEPEPLNLNGEKE